MYIQSTSDDGTTFLISNPHEVRIKTSSEQNAKKLCSELNLAIEAGKKTVLREAVQLSLQLASGFSMVPMDSDIHRQLSVMAPHNFFFLSIRDIDNKKVQYFDVYGSVIMERDI